MTLSTASFQRGPMLCCQSRTDFNHQYVSSPTIKQDRIRKTSNNRYVAQQGKKKGGNPSLSPSLKVRINCIGQCIPSHKIITH